MPPITLAPLAPAALGLPATLLELLPPWAVLVLTGITVLLTAAQVIVTQIIRLRASAQVTRSQDALRLLEIEDLPADSSAGRVQDSRAVGGSSTAHAAGPDKARPGHQAHRLHDGVEDSPCG